MEIDGGIFWKNFLESKDPYEDMFHPLSVLIMAINYGFVYKIQKYYGC